MADKNGLRSDNSADSSSLPIEDAAAQIRYAPTKKTDVFYPETDGKPMAETERHRDEIMHTLQTLPGHFADVPDVCVSGNMMMYYVEGDPRKSVAPDIFVTFGVERKERRIYRIWEEGKPPDFVLEFSSENTYRHDLAGKKELYATIGVGEYFLYDAYRAYLPSPLMGFRLVGRDYVQIPVGADGSVSSAVLKLDLHALEDGLGFYNPVSEKWLETPAEAAQARAEQAEARAEHEAARAEHEATRAEQESIARQHAEATAQQEAVARHQAEAEIARLRAENERLKGSPNAIPRSNS